MPKMKKMKKVQTKKKGFSQGPMGMAKQTPLPPPASVSPNSADMELIKLRGSKGYSRGKAK